METLRKIEAFEGWHRLQHISLKYLITFGSLVVILLASSIGSSEEVINPDWEVQNFVYEGDVDNSHPYSTREYYSWNDALQERVTPESRHSLYDVPARYYRHGGGGGWGWGWGKKKKHKKQSKKKTKKQIKQAAKRREKKKKKYFKKKFKKGGGWWIHSNPYKGKGWAPKGWGWGDPWFNDPWFWRK